LLVYRGDSDRENGQREDFELHCSSFELWWSGKFYREAKVSAWGEEERK
jgi:hypothetical protein